MEAKLKRTMVAAAAQVEAKGPEVAEWWQHLEPKAKKAYIEEHPTSKYAEQSIKEGADSNHEAPKNSLKPDSEERKTAAASITKNAASIAGHLKKTFPKITNAISALKHIATGKPLEHEQKETLHELGEMIFRSQLGKHIGGHGIQLAADLGINAVKYGIEKFKEHKAKKPDKDDIETFVEAVGEGVQKAEHTPVPAEHAKPESAYRSALSKHFKEASKHVKEVLMRSYPHLKPATNALRDLAKGEKPKPEEKHALQHMGKHALMLGIAALPGGLAAHLTAGIATSAASYAYKKMKAAKNQNETTKSLVSHFVDSIGEGLEHAFISGHLGGHHEGAHE